MTTLSIGPFEKIVTLDNHDTGAAIAGAYLFDEWQGVWLLTHWRTRPTQGAAWGGWRKVHGNQKKDIGNLRLILELGKR